MTGRGRQGVTDKAWQARRGRARQGVAERGRAWQGVTGRGRTWQCVTRRVRVGQCVSISYRHVLCANLGLYWTNPQFAMTLLEADDDDSDGQCTVIVNLLQINVDNMDDMFLGINIFRVRTINIQNQVGRFPIVSSTTTV